MPKPKKNSNPQSTTDFSDWLADSQTYTVFGKKLIYKPVDSPEHEAKDWELMTEIGNHVIQNHSFQEGVEASPELQKALASDPVLAGLQNRLIQMCFPETAVLDLTDPKLSKKRAAMLAKIQGDAQQTSVTYQEIMQVISGR